MNRTLQPARALFAIGLLGLGVLALIYHDFALDWQPVPLWVPGRTFLAYGSGVLMLACGVGVLFRSTAVWAVRILFPYLFVWMLLKVPLLWVAPGMEAVWLGFGEVVILMTGGWILWAIAEEVPPGTMLTPIAGYCGLQRALVAFGLALLPVGLSHLAYVPETVGLVPAWMPVRNFWAYLTGVGQFACGLGILFRIFPRVAAWCEAAMVRLFTLLVWLPFVVAKPTDRGSWTGFFISWTIGSSAWIVAQQEGSPFRIERARRSVSQPQTGEFLEERNQPRSEVRRS
jgi:uncharacterized membrane protein